VARKEDVETDNASKQLLDQFNTKTVGRPAAATGLVGDQDPNETVTVADFDLLKDQLTIQLSNVEAINLLNSVGNLTNTRSLSGPIVDTLKIEAATVTDSGSYSTIFRPRRGETWELIAVNGKVTNASGSNARAVAYTDGTNEVLLYYASDTSSNWQMDFEHEGSPLYVTYDCYLKGYNVGTSGGSLDSTSINMAVVRVR